jgi:hypothetical protein
MAYARKYKITPGPRGWILSEYVESDRGYEPMWVELGKYDSKEKAEEALKRTVSTQEHFYDDTGKELFFDENGEAV